MLSSIAIWIASAVAPNAAMSKNDICEVGRAALRDLPAINYNPRFDAYYAGADARHLDLLEVCPALKSELPAGFPLADDDARSRASVNAPLSGHEVRPAFIYSIGVPEINDILQTAVVRMGYSCTGLCGASFEVHYVRTAQGWKREGKIQTRSVS